jgi:hypothetical protein
MEGTAVVIDYDLRLGKNHLRGNGSRGLAALVVILSLRAAMVSAIALSAKSGAIWLVQLLWNLR